MVRNCMTLPIRDSLAATIGQSFLGNKAILAPLPPPARGVPCLKQQNAKFRYLIHHARSKVPLPPPTRTDDKISRGCLSNHERRDWDSSIARNIWATQHSDLLAQFSTSAYRIAASLLANP